MDCKGCKEGLVDFLYEELTPQARQAYQDHLEQCPACAAEAEQLSQVLNLVRAHPEEDPSEDLSQRILHAAKVATEHRAAQAAATRAAPWWRWLLSPAPMTAVLALVVVSVGLAVYVSQPEPLDSLTPAGPQAAAEVTPATPAKLAQRPAQPSWDAAPVGGPKRPVADAPSPETASDTAGRTMAEAKKEWREAKTEKPADKPAVRPLVSAPPREKRGPLDSFADAPPKPAPGRLDKARPSKRRRAKRKAKTYTPEGLLGGATGKGKKADRAAIRDAVRGVADAQAGDLATGATGGSAVGAPAGLDGVGRAGSDASAASVKQPNRAQAEPKARDGAGDMRFAVPPPPAPKPAKDAERGEDQKEERPAPEPTKVAPAAKPAPAGAPSVAMATDDMADEADYVEQESKALPEEVRTAASRKASAKRAPAPSVDLYAQADRALGRKEYDVAALGFRTFLRKRPGDARVSTARYRLARALFLAGRCAQAIPAIGQAVRAAPRHPLAAEALFDQASCHVRLGQFSQAQRAYQRIEREHPGRAGEARREAGRIGPSEVRPAADR